jgi:hypothetical protein
MSQQPLLVPTRLPRLSHLDAQLVADHLEVFSRSGFAFGRADPAAPRGWRLLRPGDSTGAGSWEGQEAGREEEGVEAQPTPCDSVSGAGSRSWEYGELLLVAVPSSRGTAFGEAEVVEMVEALAAGTGPPAAVRPAR